MRLTEKATTQNYNLMGQKELKMHTQIELKPRVTVEEFCHTYIPAVRIVVSPTLVRATSSSVVPDVL